MITALLSFCPFMRELCENLCVLGKKSIKNLAVTKKSITFALAIKEMAP